MTAEQHDVQRLPELPVDKRRSDTKGKRHRTGYGQRDGTEPTEIWRRIVLGSLDLKRLQLWNSGGNLLRVWATRVLQAAGEHFCRGAHEGRLGLLERVRLALHCIASDSSRPNVFENSFLESTVKP